MKKKLLPCPFCGSDDIYRISGANKRNERHECGSCNAHAFVDMWNKRAYKNSHSLKLFIENKVKDSKKDYTKFSVGRHYELTATSLGEIIAYRKVLEFLIE